MNKDIRDQAEDVDDQSRKRARLSDDSEEAAVELASKFRFVDFHFKMLRSLYDGKSNLSDAVQSHCDVSDVSGDKIDDDIWTKIGDFLVNRPSISSAKKEAVLWNNIRREAMQLKANTKARSPAKQTPGRIGLTPRSSVFHSKFATSSPISLSEPHPLRDNSFFIIAQLLGKEARFFKDVYNHQKHALKPLLSAAEQLISGLGQEVSVLKQAIASEEQKKLHLLLNGASYQDTTMQRDSSKDSDESRLAELQTKMRLWQLLAADLKSIL
ncbi:hypothetical protein FisN_4Lh039 [Fistulifera solaris]|uniref:Uncharacterized protein n=1 Tax=Fistulifera solaris TaxID=1519565 RepID=A0A1Z5KDB6_FISSO|nr:hypothetical protein FisN_4Lh039 [Fistulifera solaris]|eukprot:GAX24259.1 hypothetical protein FisN_4Lh039 [Fistulifera solaris]